jgi:hypothetical protein
MTPAERANLPRWDGRPGFFEIWFLVVFDPDAARAWWLRYTTFAPAPGRPGDARATLWAAAFDAGAAAPTVAAKRVLPATAFDGGPRDGFGLRLGDAELSPGVCRGRVDEGGHTIAWDLHFAPALRPSARGPAWLEALPLPTRVAHVASETAFAGWVAVDGVRHTLGAARGVQKHIWGTRRVEELFWLYCPRLAEDPAAALEATAVRLRRRTVLGAAPALAPVWLATSSGEVGFWSPRALLRNRVTPGAPGALSVEARSARRALRARAWCDPRTLVGWVYRDPSGFDLHVAQSDLASCTVELRTRPHPFAPWSAPRRLSATHAAAVEFHHPEPLPGVYYRAWDG